MFNTSIRALLLVSLLALGGCATGSINDPFASPAGYIRKTHATSFLQSLPPAERKIDIAIYEFPDLTGQHKPNDSFPEYSRAVTQGADAILVDVLSRVGNGEWFNVVERRGLPNLLRERQIIQSTRQQFNGGRADLLPALTFAGVIIEGGVIGYETNLTTGGAGARYLGIGASTEYRTDLVTVNLRFVSVTTGRIMKSVTTTKKIYSLKLQGSVFKYIASDELLELEAGFTRNDPPQLAIREAIELAVYTIVMEGAQSGLWSFADSVSGQQALETYRERRSKIANAPINQNIES
ncbi:CsgG/HfaB family protein [Pistricoccus aurantiacus]|uniref:Curli production assembly/transport component CsgG n=1 Tax=Pistricoccus aurantiacus TaxID=1883414 RepID=A0A5B8SQX6_9GAMM|nr:CsgG/HfaB family protein [Pistricoccus aurantiacus]QEA38721.1 curli production assembly protein CsgG [Pistricoccus aurantiacus]